ncbi:hypothetical protein COBT_002679 [Conglomerata obtusa]
MHPKITSKNTWSLPHIDILTNTSNFALASSQLSSAITLYAQRVDDVHTCTTRLLNNFEVFKSVRKREKFTSEDLYVKGCEHFTSTKEYKNTYNINDTKNNNEGRENNLVSEVITNDDNILKDSKDNFNSNENGYKDDLSQHMKLPASECKILHVDNNFLMRSMSSSGFMFLYECECNGVSFIKYKSAKKMIVDNKNVCPGLGRFETFRNESFNEIEPINNDKDEKNNDNYVDYTNNDFNPNENGNNYDITNDNFSTVDYCNADNYVIDNTVDNYSTDNYNTINCNPTEFNTNNENEFIHKFDLEPILSKSWAGPNFWSLKKRIKKECKNTKKTILDFTSKYDFRSIFEKGNNSTDPMVIKERRKGYFFLPEDYKMEGKDLYKYLLMDGFFENKKYKKINDDINIKKINNNLSNVNAWEIDGFGTFNDDKENFDFNTCKSFDQGYKNEKNFNSNKDNINKDNINKDNINKDYIFNTDNNFINNDYLQAPEIITDMNNIKNISVAKRILLKYTRVPKKIDIKKLKEEIYERIEKEEELINLCGEVMNNDKEISLQFCLVSVLHLANEKNLKIIGDGHEFVLRKE